ncbi:MAG: hypothetical protein J6S85_26535 [Methanobrevibacter sp.]|nr:hypothetical protein [Methanobrevibacter sp.]MBO7717152.1 hypothetical protein [Methanobrevibacter sp.]
MGLREDYEKEMLDSFTIYKKLSSYRKTIQQAVIYTLIDRYCKDHNVGVNEFCKDYLSDHMEAERMFIEL